MARIQQDQFIDEDEEEEVCPLCVEEFDLADRYFKPCPCGYQICQFCYNNIKTTMNGLCPACRRPYDEKPHSFRQVTQEELLQHEKTKAAQLKKRAAAKQKEAQRREADNLSRKHLSGLRVRQRNLVYVTGMKPKINGDRVVELLREDKWFGQYGDIIKIVVSKSKDQAHLPNQPVGIYVTFATKEAAAACIEAINGLGQGGDGKIRAQHGTTKYCSAYLRGETCNNRSCMFLHEPGESAESFTRQDLSNMNARSTQQPTGDDIEAFSPAPPQHAQPVAAAVQDLAPSSPGGEGSALPIGAGWARRGSLAISSSVNSPVAVNTVPAHVKIKSKETSIVKSSKDASSEATSSSPSSSTSRIKKTEKTPEQTALDDVVRRAFHQNIKFHFSTAGLSEEDVKILDMLPPLWDPQGGAKRRAMKEREAEELRKQEEAQVALPQETKAEPTEETEAERNMGGSLQLGGEPEEQHARAFAQQTTIQPPGFPFGPQLSSLENDLGGMSLRGGTPTQQQHQSQLLLRQLQSGGTGLHQIGGHGRQPSRFAFNEQGGIKAGTGPQQGAKIGGGFGLVATQQAPFYSAVQGPPPGLKTTGTPPVNGSGMFGQGHGFTANAYGNANAAAAAGWDSRAQHRVQDAGKREFMFPFSHNTSASSTPATGGYPYSGDGQQNQQKKKTKKKHRHANTSSSGTGEDSSIMQSRPYQNGAPAGYGTAGLYSAAGYAINNLPALGQSNEGNSSRYATPSLPLSLGPSRRPTPSLPPGLFSSALDDEALDPFLLQRNAEPAEADKSARKEQFAFGGSGLTTLDKEKAIARPASVSTTPAADSKSAVAEDKAIAAPNRVIAKEEKAARAERSVSSDPTPAEMFAASKKGARVVSVKEKASKTKAKKTLNVSKSVASEEATSDVHPRTQQHLDEKPTSSPALSSSSLERKIDSIEPNHQKKAETAKAIIATPEKKADASKPVPKRAHPGKLNLDITHGITQDESKENESPTHPSSSSKFDLLHRTSRAPSLSGTSLSSRPGTPLAREVSTGSPLKRTVQPRTLRITETPKTETPPALPVANPVAAVEPTPPSAPTPALLQTLPSRVMSRRTSIASINIPGTPTTEQADTMSVASTSMSRANSPPPGPIVGRKSRKDKKVKQEKQAAVDAILAGKEIIADEVAPIMARKTKSKRTRSGPAKEAPIKEEKKEEAKASFAPAVVASPIEAPEPMKVGIPSPSTSQAKTVAAPAVQVPATPPPRDEIKPPSPLKKESPANQLTASAILQALDATHQLALSTLNLLKPLTSQSELKKLGMDPFTSADLQNHIEQLRFELSKADEELLKQGESVRRDLGESYPASATRVSGRCFVTPAGTRLSCMTKDEEDKYIEIEKRVLGERGIARWGGGTVTRIPNLKGTLRPKKGKLQSVLAQEDVLRALSIATESLEGALRDATQGTNTKVEMHTSVHLAGPGLPPPTTTTPSQDPLTDAREYVNKFVPRMLDANPPMVAVPTDEEGPLDDYHTSGWYPSNSNGRTGYAALPPTDEADFDSKTGRLLPGHQMPVLPYDSNTGELRPEYRNAYDPNTGQLLPVNVPYQHPTSEGKSNHGTSTGELLSGRIPPPDLYDENTGLPRSEYAYAASNAYADPYDHYQRPGAYLPSVPQVVTDAMTDTSTVAAMETLKEAMATAGAIAKLGASEALKNPADLIKSWEKTVAGSGMPKHLQNAMEKVIKDASASAKAGGPMSMAELEREGLRERVAEARKEASEWEKRVNKIARGNRKTILGSN